MVDAFDATLIASVPVKIDAIAAVAVFRLFLAASNGLLLVFRMQPSSETALQLLDVIKQFAKQPIAQLLPVPALNLLIVRSGTTHSRWVAYSIDATLHLYDLGSLSFIATLPNTKGCTQVAMQQSDAPRILAACFKTKVQLYTYADKSFTESKASSLTWMNDTTLIAGLSSGQYAKIDISNDTHQILGKSGCENVVACTQDSFLASQSNSLSMVTLADSTPMIDWSKVPEEIAYLEPYCVARSAGLLEVKMTPKGDNVPAPDVGDAKCLYTDSSALYTAGTSGSIWRLAPVSFNQRMDRLVEQQKFEAALQLLDSNNGHLQERERITRKFAMHLFSTGEYDRALALFHKIETPLSEILSLYFVDPEPTFADRRKAYTSLIQDLTVQRTALRAGTLLNVDSSEEIDTALLEAYLRSNPALVGPLLRVSNSVNLTRGEELLKHREADLIELYFGQGLHEKALDYLYSCSVKGDSKLYGIQPTINYLARLPLDQLDLTLFRSTWVLQSDPMEGMIIFTREGAWEDVESQRKIAQYLRALSPPLCTAYLEHVVEQGSLNAEFYNRLLIDYTDEIKSDRHKHAKALMDIRGRLRTLLEAPSKYDAEQILQALPTEEFFEERSILYSRLGQHDKALDLIVNGMQDRAMAEQYCLKHYDTQKNRDLFVLLLQYYVSEVTETLQLVNKYGRQLQASKTLDFVSDDTKLEEIAPFLEKSIQETTDLRFTNAILKPLALSDRTSTGLALIDLLRQRVTITYDRTCQQCFKRLGTSLFVEAQEQLYHYSCFSSQIK